MEEYVAVKALSDFYVDTWSEIAVSMRTAFIVSSGREFATNRLEQLGLAEGGRMYSNLLASIKREALLFDKIYIVEDLGYRSPSPESLTEIEWLLEKSIVSTIKADDIAKAILEKFYPLDKEAFHNSYLAMKTYLENMEILNSKHRDVVQETGRDFDKIIEKLEEDNQIQKMLNEFADGIEKINQSFVKNIYPFSIIMTRFYALILEKIETIIATPLLSYSSYHQKLANSTRSNVAQVVIRDLPLPKSNTPWERIIEYRENPDNQNNLLKLRRWIRKLSAENLSAVECKQELDWLKNEFQSHLKLHKIKANAATFEAIVKAPLEILENLVTLKFSKIPDPLFAIKKRQISLMEAELNAPGREIAYLIKSKQEFE